MIKVLRNFVKRQLTWNNLSTVASSPLVKVISAIPLVGYAILWSDALVPFFKYAENFGDRVWFTFVHRLYIVYFASLAILIGYVIYLVRCPIELKENSSYKSYFNWLTVENNSAIIDEILVVDLPVLKRKMSSDRNEIILIENHFKMEPLSSSTSANKHDYNSEKLARIMQYGTNSRAMFARLVRVHYRYLNYLNESSRLACSFFFALGIIGLTTLSVEIFTMVLLKLLSIAFV